MNPSTPKTESPLPTQLRKAVLGDSIRRCILTALCIFVGERAVDAAIIVTAGSSAPSDHVLTSYSVGYDNFAWGVDWKTDSTRTDSVQSFLVSGTDDWFVDKITVKVREFGTSVANQAFHVETWTVSNASAVSGNTMVNSQSGTFPASGLTAGYWTFDIADVTLTKGNYYAFVLGFDSGPDSERYFNLVHAYSANDLYPDGRMFFREGTPPSWQSPSHISDRDFDFSIQGSVPEPSAFALLATGLPFLMWRKRKQS